MGAGSTKCDSDNTTDVEQNAQSHTGHSEKEKAPDPNEVDWNGPDDPKNPRNWPAWRRFMLVGVITLVVFSTWVEASEAPSKAVVLTPITGP